MVTIISRVRALTCAAVLAVAALAGLPALLRAQVPATRTANLDTVLDLYVRDGLVYYRALKSDRARLDSFVASLASASLDGAPPAEQIAFWLNAYNAIVLKTVIDQYPI